MKSFFKTFVLVALAVLLTGCDTFDVSSENPPDISDLTSSLISKDNSLENSLDLTNSAETSSEPMIDYSPLKRNEVTLLDVEGNVVKCTDQEATLFAKTEKALDYVFFFASWANHKNYQNTEELLEEANVCRWLVPELIRTRGLETTDKNGDFTLSKNEVSRYLYCYFGIETATSQKETLPTGVEGAPYDIHEISLVKVEGNFAKFKCVFNKGLYDGDMTFEVMKSDKKTFLRLISITDMTEEFKTAKEASLTLN